MWQIFATLQSGIRDLVLSPTNYDGLKDTNIWTYIDGETNRVCDDSDSLSYFIFKWKTTESQLFWTSVICHLCTKRMSWKLQGRILMCLPWEKGSGNFEKLQTRSGFGNFTVQLNLKGLINLNLTLRPMRTHSWREQCHKGDGSFLFNSSCCYTSTAPISFHLNDFGVITFYTYVCWARSHGLVILQIYELTSVKWYYS